VGWFLVGRLLGEGAEGFEDLGGPLGLAPVDPGALERLGGEAELLDVALALVGLPEPLTRLAGVTWTGLEFDHDRATGHTRRVVEEPFVGRGAQRRERGDGRGGREGGGLRRGLRQR